MATINDDDVDSDKFMTPPQSDDDDASLDVEKLFYGDALDGLDEDAQEGLRRNCSDLNEMGLIKDEDEQTNSTSVNNQRNQQQQRSSGDKVQHRQSLVDNSEVGRSEASNHHVSNAEDRKEQFGDRQNPEGGDLNCFKSDDEGSDQQHSYELSEEVQTKLETLYTIQPTEPGQETMRVVKFTTMFLPDTENRRQKMEEFNKDIMLDKPDFENELIRERRRDLKDGYKKALKSHKHKAQYLPVNPQMEDFYYLQGFNKNGVAPTSNKKVADPPGYKPLYSSTKNDLHHPIIEKVVPQSARMSKRAQISLQQQQLLQQNNQSANHAADLAKKEQDQKDADQKDFTLEACQINELKSGIQSSKRQQLTGQENKDSDDQNLEKLKVKLRQAKVALKVSLDQKIPQAKTNRIQQQSFAMLNTINQFYTQKPASAAPKINRKNHKKQKQLPSEVDLYEMQISKKFEQAGIPQKRVKYWGELKNCVSESQKSKDSNLIRRQEWLQYVSNKSGYKQPVFSIVTNCQSKSAAETAVKDPAKPGAPFQNKPNGPLAPNTIIPGSILRKPPGFDQAQNPAGSAGPNGRQARRPLPIVVEKSDFDLVTSFDEYEKLKQQEVMYYRQRKKTSVTAESIMRHVRWKMGKLSDKDFYREEYQEMRKEMMLEEKANKMHQSQLSQQSRIAARRPIHQVSTPKTDLTEAEPKDIESSKKSRTVPINFEENFDSHFDRKRLEIQERILRLKDEKEKASTQKQNTTQTPAYEPIVAQDNKESEDDHRGSDHKENGSDDESSSSDSDSDDEEAVSMQQGAGHTMINMVADELQHAVCINDLSFFKLNWSDRDLQTFHRPHVQLCFQETALNGKILAAAVSNKKEEKEARLDAHLYFKHRLKLSLNKGKFCIFEHIDQHPLFVNNFGMASRLRRYYYGDKQPSKKEFLNQKNENIANRHIGPYGKFIMKQKLEKIDLLGQCDKEKFNGLTILENNMYNAPVFYHRIPSTNNDFFCSMIKQKDSNERRIVIRSLSSFYTVGQIEPKREVYNPQSRHFTHFIKTQSKAYTTRLLQENKRMSFHDIRQFFPQIGSPILKKGLKEIEVEQDRLGMCWLNANFEMERHKDRMTPEMICQFESARHGQYRLERHGISEILSADKISYSTHKFCFEETDLKLQRVAKMIESEVLQTPWNLSSNYIKIKQEGSMMMLEGQGDPSFGHGGYSYLKMPLKISADSIQGAKANRMNLNPAIQNPKAVTGTEADLRKLKKDTLYKILLDAGVLEEELRQKTRWEMVALLRCFASQQVPSQHLSQNDNQMKSFYARGVRNTSKKQQEMYNKRANSTFRKQMDYLSEPNPRDLHDLSEDEPDFTQLPDLKAMGLEKIGKGFGTSLNKPKKVAKDKEAAKALITFREPGINAKDFTQDIYDLVHDESRKQIVEIETMPEVTKIEDIKDYLKLFLVIHPNALSPQNQNPSGINIGGVSSNAEFLYAMNGNGSKEWEKKLLEKLQNREISKKCEILCHKIRSLTYKEDEENVGLDEEKKEKDEDADADAEKNDEDDKDYERVIFCADEKAIKKFKRCMNKNQMRTPRRTNRRNLSRATKPLNAENLKLQAAKSKHGLSRTGKRSNSNQSLSSSVRRGSGAKVKTVKSSQKGDGSIYSQPTQNVGKVKLGGGGLSQHGASRNMNSGQKPKFSKKNRKPIVVTQSSQPTLRFNITNNGYVPMPQPPTHSLALQSDQMPLDQISLSQPSQLLEQQNKPIQIVALSGAEIPMSQPVESQNQGMVQFNVGQNLSQPANGDLQGNGTIQEEGSQENDDDNNLVNNEEISMVASDYRPDAQLGEDSDEMYDEFNMGKGGKGSQFSKQSVNRSPIKKKRSVGKGQYLQSQMSSLSLSRQKSTGKNGRRKQGQSATAKFVQHGFGKDDYEYQNLTSNKSRRRQQQDGTQSLNNIFMDIVDKLMESEDSYLFHNQPTRSDAPNYRDIIISPIALKDMKNKSKRNEYKDRAMFENDIALMVSNAERFNGPLNQISEIARELQSRAQALLDKRAGDIETMECVIKMDVAGF